MTLSPTASLADYAIDFIDVNGTTTTLSLTSDNASTTALTWTVPDKPWSDGDLLMLRIHKPVSNDATLSALALSGVDITFSTATTTYTASVPATTTQTTVTPTLNHDAATYVVKLGGVADDDGTIPLAVGANVISVEVTAEDAVTTQTYTVTVTRATPSEPVSLTLIPRVNVLTFFDIDIQWNYSGSCENYFVAITTATNYQISFLGFHPPETSSHYVEGGWLYNNVPDFWVVVECRTSVVTARRSVAPPCEPPTPTTTSRANRLNPTAHGKRTGPHRPNASHANAGRGASPPTPQPRPSSAKTATRRRQPWESRHTAGRLSAAWRSCSPSIRTAPPRPLRHRLRSRARSHPGCDPASRLSSR